MTEFIAKYEPTIGLVTGVIIAVGIIVTSVVKTWPFLSKVVTMVNAFVGTADEPGVLHRIKHLEHHDEEEQRNHQKMSTQLDRVETRVHVLGDRVDAFTEESNQDRRKLWEFAHRNHGGEQS